MGQEVPLQYGKDLSLMVCYRYSHNFVPVSNSAASSCPLPSVSSMLTVLIAPGIPHALDPICLSHHH